MPNPLQDFLESNPAAPILFGGALAIVVMLGIALFVWKVFVVGARGRDGTSGVDDLFIDVAALPEDGPPDEGPQLTCYGVPVRLAALVVAPAGRDVAPPEPELYPSIVEAMVPGMTQFVARDHPRIDGWPPQLSASGFAQLFFSRVRLPEDRGRGTPWASIVGRVTTTEQSYLVGALVCAQRPNSLSEIKLQQPGHWLDVLRTRAD